MIITGNSLDELKKLDASSVDSVVTDPPYGLSFMGKKWDHDVPTVAFWREVFRVLKPGGHVLSFGGTRTYHRLVVAIEDAGFEIRDQIQWIYGSGFPKSQNIGKVLAKAGHTEQALTYEGFGTALKPANEPICVARKPLEKGLTVAANVLKYGTGGINIEGTRIASSDKLGRPFNEANNEILGTYARFGNPVEPSGRWPANIILSEEAAAELDVQAEAVSRFFYVAKASKSERNAGLEGMPQVKLGVGDERPSGQSMQRPDGREAREMANHHPTVKPVKLMEYLIKLVTPQGGIVLDPFMGSGTTGVAAKNLGFEFIGIELNPEYAEIAENRIFSCNVKKNFQMEF